MVSELVRYKIVETITAKGKNLIKIIKKNYKYIFNVLFRSNLEDSNGIVSFSVYIKHRYARYSV